MRVNRSQGSALLTTLLIVSMIVIFVAFINREQKQYFETIKTEILAVQGFQYALGMEAHAVNILMNKPKEVVYTFPMTIPKETYEKGSATGEIIDMQSFYNINNLADENKVEGFVHLLNSINPAISRDEAKRIANVIKLYLTDNKGVIQTTPPHRMPGQNLVSFTELYTIPTLTAPTLNSIKPYVTALPASTFINLNSVSPILITSLSPLISMGIVGQFATLRESAPLTQQILSDFFTRNAITKLGEYSLESQFFLVKSTIEIDDFKLVVYSLLNQAEKDKQMRVIWRSRGRW